MNTISCSLSFRGTLIYLLFTCELLTTSTLFGDTSAVRGRAFFSILDSVEAPGSGSFNQAFRVAQFDPGFGSLSKVTVDWVLGGEVEVGVSVRGPQFPSGGGTVSGSSSLSFMLNLPTSQIITANDTVSGTHTGRIAGPPGVGASDVLSLPFAGAGSVVFTDQADLSLFTGGGTFEFDVLLTMFDVRAAITNGGPRFLMRVGIPPARVEATVTYDYRPIPETSTGTQLLAALLAVTIRRRSILVYR